jgi:hypothetical protein
MEITEGTTHIFWVGDKQTTCLLNVLFLFLYNVPCCFYFITRFCSKSTEVFLCSFFYSLFGIYSI